MMNHAILANHAHVFPAHLQPAGSVDRLLRLLDACAIAECVCFAPFAHQMRKLGFTEEPNGWLAAALRPHARLFGFGTLDFAAGDLPGQVRRIADLGFRGIKLHHNGQEVGILSPQALEVYAEAERRGLFLVFHAAAHRNRLKETRILDFDEVAWNFPKLRFSLEHVGGYHFFHEALAVLFNHMPTPWAQEPCHLYGGLSSVFSTQTNRFWHLSRDRLLELVTQVGPGQLIFGLDFPYNQEQETLLGIQTIRDLGLSQQDQANILGGNLRDLLAGRR